MTEEVKNAPTPEELKAQETAKAEAEAKAAKEATVGDILNPEKKDKEVKMVPEAALLEYKKEAKELAKEIKDLRKQVEEGASRGEISDDIKTLAEDFGVTEEQVSKLVKAVGTKNKKELEAEIEAKLKPIEDEKSSQKFDKVFGEHFSKAMESMPEYKTVVNQSVIKDLALNPKNSGKTLTKIIEEAFGHLIQGKKTMESARAGGDGKVETDIDFAKATKDSEYFKEIMSNPESKKKYNEGLIGRLKL